MKNSCLKHYFFKEILDEKRRRHIDSYEKFMKYVEDANAENL